MRTFKVEVVKGFISKFGGFNINILHDIPTYVYKCSLPPLYLSCLSESFQKHVVSLSGPFRRVFVNIII